MSLATGSRLGPYEISGKLGEGGMGEVYRARDTRLGRTVAIKVLPAFLAADPELRARLEREARAISSLQHPHICTLFDIGQEGDRDYLVMEYLDGEPLSARLARGPLSLEETLRFGRQIAEALDKAHRQGIVHRDLKPGNVIVTRTGIKLLDFGLAKLQKGLNSPGPLAGPLDSRTVLTGSEPLTTAGTVVGTPEYMAPEQLEGRDTDSRCDLWALGCVLYQMVTGTRPFARENLASVITAIMSSEPQIPQGSVPPGLERLIRFCLTKDPEQRWQSAYDLALELESLATAGGLESTGGILAASGDPSSASLPAAKRRRGGWLWGGLGLAALLAGGLFWGSYPRGSSTGPPQQVRFELAMAPGVEISQSVEVEQLAMSPDGRMLAYVGSDQERVWRVYLRPLAEGATRPLPGTEGASSILWAPDGKTIAFFTAGKLKRLEVAGGTPVILCDVDPSSSFVGTWSTLGTIAFSSIQGNSILRIAASGGVPEKILDVDTVQTGTRVYWPVYLPDGKRLLFLQLGGDGSRNLMLLEPDQPARPVAPIASRVQLIGKDLLVYVQEGALLAQHFDADAGQLKGVPTAITPRVNYFYSTGWAGFAASPSGGAFFVSATDSSQLYSYDRSGQRVSSLGTPAKYLSFSLAQNDKTLLADRMQAMYGTYDIWELDLDTGAESRLTSSLAAEFSPILMPDGKEMIYSSARLGIPNLIRRTLLPGAEEVLLPSKSFQQAFDVSAAGDLVAFVERKEKGGFRGSVLALTGDRQVRALFPLESEQNCLRFSPDGRYLAFLSNDTEKFEAYLAPLDKPSERVRLSRRGARRLRWRRDGREILWISPQNEVVAIAVRTTPKVEVGEPRVLFAMPEGANLQDFDVTSSGERLIVLLREQRGGVQPATVILGWSPESGE